MTDPAELERILTLLPQRAPAVLIDRLELLEHGARAVGWKTFPAGDRVFDGHLPGDPIVPGVMLVEALAQVSGCALVPPGFGQPIGGYLAGIGRFRFRRLVRPGEAIRLEARLEQRLGSAAQFAVEARVGDEVAAEGQLTVGGMR